MADNKDDALLKEYAKAKGISYSGDVEEDPAWNLGPPPKDAKPAAIANPYKAPETKKAPSDLARGLAYTTMGSSAIPAAIEGIGRTVFDVSPTEKLAEGIGAIIDPVQQAAGIIPGDQKPSGTGFNWTPPAEGTPVKDAAMLEAKYIPGGWHSTLSPGANQEFEAGFGLSKNATVNEVNAARRAAEQQEAIRLNARDAEANRMAEVTGRQEGQYFSAMNELNRMQKIKEDADLESDTAIKELRQSQVDPNRFFTQRDTFSNIMLALNVAMGSFWSVFTKQNAAQDIIDKAIAQDIRAQEVNLSNKRAATESLLAKNLSKTSDLNRARELTRMQLLELTRLQLTKMAQDNASAVESANAAKIFAGLDTAMERAKARLTLEHAQFRASTEAQTAGGYSIGGMSLSGLLGKTDDRGKRWVTGVGLAPTPEVAAKLNGELGDAAVMQQMLGEMGTLASKMSRYDKALGAAEVFNTPEYARLNQLTKDLMFKKSSSEHQGVIRQSEWKAWEEMVGDPTSFVKNPQAVHSVLSKLYADSKNYLNSRTAGSNVQPGHILNVRNPMTGEVQRIYVLDADTPESINGPKLNSSPGTVKPYTSK